MKRRDKLYKEAIKEKDSQKKIQKHETYKEYRKKIVDLLKVSKQTHYKKYFEDNRKNCKALWDGIHQIIYSQKKKDNIRSSSLQVNWQTVTDKLNTAEKTTKQDRKKIRKKLQNKIYPTNRDYSHYLRSPNQNTFFSSPTSPEEVINFIQDLKTSKSTGPNSLPHKIIKQIKKTIPLPLSESINKSFAQGTFPSAFKTAKLVPILKNESTFLCNNYRPISLLSNVSKIIEKLMHKRLNKFLEQEACFYILQIGFCLNCSTNNSLMSVIENIQTQLDDNKYTAGVFADLEKAFDTVDHDTFIEKLNHCGVRGVAKDWFISYLKGRR